jgi:hypothetical protein
LWNRRPSAIPPASGVDGRWGHPADSYNESARDDERFSSIDQSGVGLLAADVVPGNSGSTTGTILVGRQGISIRYVPKLLETEMRSRQSN